MSFKSCLERSHPRQRFTLREDQVLTNLVNQRGTDDWNKIADMMPGRNVRQVKERWYNYLSPDVNQKPWTEEEEKLLYEKHEEFGNRWRLISKYFEGRSEINIKSKFQRMERHKAKQLKKDMLSDIYRPSSSPLPQLEQNSTNTSSETVLGNGITEIAQATYDHLNANNFTNEIDFIFDEPDSILQMNDFEWF